MEKKHKIGIIGTGFMASGLTNTIKYRNDLEVSCVLTRRNPATVIDFPLNKSLITNDVLELIKNSDLVVECSGDVIYATETVEKIMGSGLPVVTMNPDLQIIAGTYLSKKGLIVEAEGDQPGCLAVLDKEVKDFGFTPIVYGNIKRFLNLNPTPEEMDYWSKKQGISLERVTSFTDGTKVQVEQALVANGLGATIIQQNLAGVSCDSLEDGAFQLAELSERIGKPISDYILSSTAPAGVFIVAKHKEEQKAYLEYLKLGSGPYYLILRPYHLCHLEVPRTIINILSGNKSYSFNNGKNPTIQVAAVAKRKIEKGEFIKLGSGSFVVRGEAVEIKNCLDSVPIGLMQDAKIIKPIEEEQIIKFSDVECSNSRALEIWKETLEGIKNNNYYKLKVEFEAIRKLLFRASNMHKDRLWR